MERNTEEYRAVTEWKAFRIYVSYVLFQVCLLVSLIVFQFASGFYFILPLILFDVVHFAIVTVEFVRNRRNERCLNYLDYAIDFIAVVSVRIFIALYLSGSEMMLNLIGAPLVLSTLVSLGLRECSEYNIDTLHNTLRMSNRILRVIFFYSFSSKIDGLFSADWILILLPLIVLHCLSLIFSFLAEVLLIMKLAKNQVSVALKFYLWMASLVFLWSLNVVNIIICISFFDEYILFVSVCAILSCGIMILHTFLARNTIMRYLIDTNSNLPPKLVIEEKVTKKVTIRRKSSTFFELGSFVQDIPSEIIDSKSDRCSVCISREANSVFRQCGHGGICYDCAVCIFKNKGKCFLCRETIENVLKVTKNGTDRFNIVSETKIIQAPNQENDL